LQAFCISLIVTPKDQKIQPPSRTAVGAMTWWLPPVIIIVLTALLYYRATGYDFINWDDPDYVTNNAMVRLFGADRLGDIFSTPVAGNYHPLTIISLGLDQALSGGKTAFPFHLENILLHILNSVLVYVLLRRLFSGFGWWPLLGSLVFALHPMHIESVAWISERKDVLYTAFFLGGMLTYSRYLEEKVSLWYGLTLLLFIFSVLSKPAAVIFPLVLLLMDYGYKPASFSKKSALGKWPFFLIALGMGIITLQLQRSEALSDLMQFSIWQKICFASYGLVMYVVKFFVPLQLSPLYAYPVFSTSESLPFYFHLMPLLVLALALGAGYLIRNNHRLSLGLGMFFLGLVLVLQLITVGNAVMADRYSYLSYVGLIIFLLQWIYSLFRPDTHYTLPQWSLLAAAIFVGILGMLAWRQLPAWKDSKSLWTTAIKQDDTNVLAYFNRALAYNALHWNEESIRDLDKIIALKPSFYKAYANRAIAYEAMKNKPAALQDFNKALSINQTDDAVYNSRGHLYHEMGKYEDAYKDYEKAIALNPHNAQAYNNRAIIRHLKEDFIGAMQDYDQALKIAPSYSSARKNRDALLKSMGK